MNVWMAYPAAETDEAAIAQQPWLAMPWQNMPNLNQIHSAQELNRLITQLMPDAPPETVSRRTEVLWKNLVGLQKETILAVPLRQSRKVAFAEITGLYDYVPARISQPAQHRYPVRWYNKQVAWNAFGKYADRFADDSVPVYEVSNAEFRNLIRNKLPLGYNRFRRWTWLLAIGFGLHLVTMLKHLVEK